MQLRDWHPLPPPSIKRSGSFKCSQAARMTWSFLTVNTTRSFPSDPVCDQFTAHISASRAVKNASARRHAASSPVSLRGKHIRWTPSPFRLVKARAVGRELHGRHQVSTVVHPVAFTLIGYRKNSPIKHSRFYIKCPRDAVDVRRCVRV